MHVKIHDYNTHELHKVIFINYTPIKLFFFMRSKKQESHREKQSIDI
jgi:hypothetical protein